MFEDSDELDEDSDELSKKNLDEPEYDYIDKIAKLLDEDERIMKRAKAKNKKEREKIK